MEFANIPGTHDRIIISDNVAYEAFEDFVFQPVDSETS